MAELERRHFTYEALDCMVCQEPVQYKLLPLEQVPRQPRYLWTVQPFDHHVPDRPLSEQQDYCPLYPVR